MLRRYARGWVAPQRPSPDGVVVHPGSSVGEPMHEALRRVADMVKHALAESDKCRLLLENAAGTGNTIGRTFVELREVIDLAGGDRRIGVCLDSCHMFATGFDIRTPDKLSEVMDRFADTVGIRGLKSLHVNDSMTPRCPPSSRASARAGTPRTRWTWTG
jgi:deoxyribonuclease IV